MSLRLGARRKSVVNAAPAFADRSRANRTAAVADMLRQRCGHRAL